MEPRKSLFFCLDLVIFSICFKGEWTACTFVGRSFFAGVYLCELSHVISAHFSQYVLHSHLTNMSYQSFLSQDLRDLLDQYAGETAALSLEACVRKLPVVWMHINIPLPFFTAIRGDVFIKMHCQCENSRVHVNVEKTHAILQFLVFPDTQWDWYIYLHFPNKTTQFCR